MSKLSKSSSATRRHTSTRRYWRQTASPRPWWPWGLLSLFGLAVLFLFGALVTAPNIQAEVRSEVAGRLESSAIAASVVRGDGQGIDIQAVAPIEEQTYLHALAKSTQCDTWAGQLTCPTTVSVLLTEPPSTAAATAPDSTAATTPQPFPATTPEPLPASTSMPASSGVALPDPGPGCDAQFDEILSATSVRFATGSATIDRGNEDLLQRLAQTARSCPGSLIIMGHTDNRGAADANQALSLARAQAVGDALVQLGIESERLTAKGFGETNPIADNETAEGRAKNRRIAIMIEQSN